LYISLSAKVGGDWQSCHVCVRGYAKKVRAVPTCIKRQAYAAYKITEYKTGDYEVDHLIPLSLGRIELHS
jgi:hypothetical protein